jgi:hypothetical protein
MAWLDDEVMRKRKYGHAILGSYVLQEITPYRILVRTKIDQN